MKTLYSIIFLTLVSILGYSQAPEAFNYQAVMRNASGDILTNAQIAVQISILQDSESGTAAYVERFNPTTNDYGLIALKLGKGTVQSGTFNTIDWGAHAHYIKIEVDPNNGTDFTSMGTTQLLSVPYALYAKSGGDDDADLLDGHDGSYYTDASNINSGPLDNAYFSAYGDLMAEGYLDESSATDLLTLAQAESRYATPKVAFLAINQSTDAISASGWQIVEFDEVIFNDGDDYDNVNDQFVAPVDGVYHFSFKVAITGFNVVGNMIAGFLINSVSIKTHLQYSATTNNHEITLNGSITYKLNAGDIAQVRVYTSSDPAYSIANNIYNTAFSGHIVYAY